MQQAEACSLVLAIRVGIWRYVYAPRPGTMAPRERPPFLLLPMRWAKCTTCSPLAYHIEIGRIFESNEHWTQRPVVIVCVRSMHYMRLYGTAKPIQWECGGADVRLYTLSAFMHAYVGLYACGLRAQRMSVVRSTGNHANFNISVK